MYTHTCHSRTDVEQRTRYSQTCEANAATASAAPLLGNVSQVFAAAAAAMLLQWFSCKLTCKHQLHASLQSSLDPALGFLDTCCCR